MGSKEEKPDIIEKITKLFDSTSSLIKNVTIFLLLMIYLVGNIFVERVLPQFEGLWKLICGILFIAIIIIAVKIKRSKNRNLQKEEKESSEKPKTEEVEIAEKLKQMETESEKKDRIISDWENKKKVFEKVLNGEIPIEVGYYMVNKPAYEKFKTKLHIRKCILDVRLEKKEGSEKEYNLKFKWELVIKNNGPEPIEKAHFIYSGDKGVYKLPDVTCKELGCKGSEFNDRNNEVGGIKVLGDDRFLEIFFASELKEGQTENICIEYVLKKYTYNCEKDAIWLVPDALGFAEISEFCIRVIWYKNIIQEETEVELMKYWLDGQNQPKQRSVQKRKYPIENSSGEIEMGGYFEAEGSESMDGSLHGVGYVLTLTNKEIDQAKPQDIDREDLLK